MVLLFQLSTFQKALRYFHPNFAKYQCVERFEWNGDFSGFTFDDEWVIEVQHQDNYISVYKNNDRLLKNVGEVVRAGEPVAITGSAKDKANNASFYLNFGSRENLLTRRI
jgi:hypothetical protein